jgi:hypothetical protein
MGENNLQAASLHLPLTHSPIRPFIVIRSSILDPQSSILNPQSSILEFCVWVASMAAQAEPDSSHAKALTVARVTIMTCPSLLGVHVALSRRRKQRLG